MNGDWGYNAGSENSCRSAATILHEMIQVVSRDGNYLLNIGTKGDGSMTAGSTNILTAFAAWMNSYGDSVHGTTASPYSSEPAWGYYTKKSGKLYAHVFNWPSGGTLQIPMLTNNVNRVSLLNAGSTYVDSGVDFLNNAGNITHQGNVISFCNQGDSGAYQIVNYQMKPGDLITVIWWAKSTYGQSSQNVKLLRAASLASTYASLVQLTNSTAALNDTGNGGAFSQYALNYTVTAADAGKYVAVSLMSPGTPGSWATFDDFSLTLTTVPPPLTAALVGSQIQLNWPPTYTGWQLQMQTNAPGFGLGSNWIAVPGSTTTYPNLRAGEHRFRGVFYRLLQ